jgi:hypothetical protein
MSPIQKSLGSHTSRERVYEGLHLMNEYSITYHVTILQSHTVFVKNIKLLYWVKEYTEAQRNR